MPPISVYLIHRYQILSDALKGFLDHSSDIELVGTSDSSTKAISDLQNRDIDIVLFDNATCRSAPRFVRGLRKLVPQAKIVPFGSLTDEQIVELLEAGACGYVNQDASLEELQQILRQVYRNQAPASSQVVASVLERLRELSQASPRPATGRRRNQTRGRGRGQAEELTAKERQVLEFLSEGCSNQEISSRLQISLSTVKMHVHHVLSKLNVGRRRDAVRVASEFGLLQKAWEPSHDLARPPKNGMK